MSFKKLSTAAGLVLIAATQSGNLALAQEGMSDVTGGPYGQWKPGREQTLQDSANISASRLGMNLSYGDFIVRPYVGLRYRKDNNIYWDSQDTEEDGIFTFAPGVLVRYGDQTKHWIEADYSHEWHVYDDFSEEDYTADIFGLRAHTQGDKTFFTVGDTYAKTRRDNIEAQARLDETRNLAYGDVERVISRKTSLAALASYQTVDYEENQELNINPVDYDELRVGGRGYYRAFTRTDLFLQYVYGIVDLDDDASPDDYGDATYHEVSLGARGQLTGKSTIQGTLGYQHRTFEGDIEDISDYTAGLGVHSTFSQRFRGGCDLVATINPSVTTPGSSVHSTRIAPFLTRDLFYDTFTGSLGGAYERGYYYNPDGKEDYEDDYWEVSAQLDWHPLHQVTLGVGYVHQESRGNEVREEIQRDQVFVRMGASY